MTKTKNIRHMLRNEKHWNPFNDAFSSERIADELKKYVEDQENKGSTFFDQDDRHSISIVKHIHVYNSYFKELYNYIRSAIDRSSAHPEHIMKYIIAMGNCDTINLDSYLSEKINEELDGFILEKIPGYNIEETKSGVPINALGAFEMQVDLINMLLNYLRYFITEKGLHDNYNEEELIKVSNYLYRSFNVMYTVKDSYDRIVWEDGEIKEIDKDRIRLKYKDDHYAIIQKAGQHRVIENVMAAAIETQAMFVERPFYRLMLNKKRKKAQIKDVRVDARGFVSVKVSTAKDYPFIEQLLIGFSSVFSLYPHISMDELDGMNGLTILDVIVLYTSLTDLTHHLKVNLESLNNEEKRELKSFFIRIKKRDLVSYLQNVTLFSSPQIDSFLRIVESDIYQFGSRINLWSRPLIKTKDVYYLLLASLQAPNYLNLIDEWLEAANFSLKQRGTALEKLIKEELPTYLISKDKNAIIPTKQKFSLSKHIYEEIDLVISMEKMILIAEVKNIKFPMETRDYHNGFKRLKEGAEQVKRKRDFLMKNSSVFYDELSGIDGKNVHIVVITNYPHFTGMKIEGVPVIDYNALKTYLNTGEIINNKASIFDEENVEIEETGRIKLWNSIDEFYNGLENYLNWPTVVANLANRITLTDSLITLKEASPQMFVSVANFT